MDYRRVIVIGEDHYNTLGLLRSLGRKGLASTLFLLGNRIGLVERCRYIQDIFEVLIDDIIDKLLLFESADSYPPIVFCTSDEAISILDANYNKLKNKFCFFNCGEQGKLTYYMSKETMRSVAAACDFLLPKTWMKEQNTTLAACDYKYPCISKINSSVFGGKADMHVNYNYNDLLKNTLSDKEYIIQEYIEKDFEDLVLGCSSNRGNQIFMPGVVRKIRHYPDSNGVTTFGCLESFELHPELDIQTIKKFVKELSYEGLFSLEFVVKDGLAYFLEINLRNDGLCYASTSAGLNLPYLYYSLCDVSSTGLPPTSFKLNRRVYFMNEFKELNLLRDKKITLIQMIKDVLKAKCFFIWNFKDNKPFRFMLHNILRKRIRTSAE